jgi:hypothetical protein
MQSFKLDTSGGAGKAFTSVGIFILLVVGSFGFVSVQDYFHRNDDQRIEQDIKRLEALDIQITALQQQLDKDGRTIDQLNSRLSSESNYTAVTTYNSDVDTYNRLRASYLTDYDRYEKLVNDYNAELEIAKQFAENSGKRWVLLPRGLK